MPNVKKFPTSSAGSTSGSGSNGTWANPNNIFATDGANATSNYWLDVTSTHSVDSGLLVGKGFGFALPANAVIDGIKVDIVGGGSLVGSTVFSVGKGAKTATKSGTFVLNGSIGGPTDNWGRSDWSASDINDATFFVSFDASASHDPADANASVDSLAVTIYYHTAPIPVPTTPTVVPTREVYKVYNAAGTYLGNLPQPTTPLKLPQDINSLGTQITVNIPVSPDTSMLTTDAYTTEDGSANYTDEAAANNYTTEGQIPIVSAAFQQIDTLIKNGNIVQAWLYNYWYPNGKCMFVGKMRRIEADHGSDSDSGDGITFLLYSTGYDMDNYVTRGLPFVLTDDQVQLSQNTSATITGTGDKFFNQQNGQSFRIATATNIGGITIKLNGAADVTLGLYDSANGSLLASSTKHVDTAGVAADAIFYMPTTIAAVPGNSYFFGVSVASGQSILIYYQNTDVYANGTAYALNQNMGWGVLAYGPIAGDLYFKVSSGTPNTTATFTAKDPTIGMLEPIMDDYNGRGGAIQYNSGTIDATGLSLTYTFKVQTLYEALQAILSMSPNGFYYYLDLGTQLLYFKNQSLTADFIFTKGVDINALKVITTTEGSTNDLLFTGGDLGAGVNLYKEYKSSDSIAAYGPLLDRKTDSRVTLSPTADAVGVSEIAQKSGEQHQTTITIPHTTALDITLLVPGKTIGFRGYGTFVDKLILQIVHREWSAESVTLTVGLLPKRLSYEFENTTRQLIAAQTQDNPTAPS